MSRAVAVLALLCAGFFLVAPTGADAKRPKVAKRCAKLKGNAKLNGKRVVRTAAAKLVAVRWTTTDEGSRDVNVNVYGCALPNGRVHRIHRGGTSYSGGYPTGAGIFKLRRKAGAFIFYSAASWGSSESDRVFRIANLRTGKSFPVVGQGAYTKEEPTPTRPLLNARGQFVAMLSNRNGSDKPSSSFSVASPPSGRTQVIAFNASTRRHVLDDAPVSAISAGSLTLTGSVASWTNAGKSKSVDLSTLGGGGARAHVAKAQRCGKLRGRVRIKTTEIKVVERKVADRRLKGTRLLGCSLPRGKVRVLGERGVPRGADERTSMFAVDYELGVHAGRYVEVRRSEGDGSLSEQVRTAAIVHLSSGRRRQFYEALYDLGHCRSSPGVTSVFTPPITRVALSASGVFAVLYSNAARADDVCAPNDGQALLVGFPDRSVRNRVTLDLAPIGEIPPESVRAGTTRMGWQFSWTRAGRPQSQTSYYPIRG